jgi:acetolactate synthase-1/2/3 large subunit
MGNHWSEVPQDSLLRTAELVLVLDCDVPWIKAIFKPRSDASIYHIDCDALKVQMSLFHLDTDLSCQANSKIALEQLNTFIANAKNPPRGEVIRSRIEDLKARHDLYRTKINEKEILPTSDEVITPHYALSRLRMMLDENSVILSEAISNYRPVADVLLCNSPGSYFTSGATALGWHGGAAIGVKLAHPERTVISVTGDGTFLFSIPSTVHWISRKYNAPFLTVILNNRGWKSPMLSAIAVHKDGFSSQMTSDDLHVTFDPPPDYAQVAVAAGAGYGKTVKLAKDIDQALKEGLETVRGGRSAVIDIWLPKFTVGDRVG